MHFDSTSARLVFQSPVTKVLVPLDVTRALKITLDLLDRIPEETTRVGAFLRRILAGPPGYQRHAIRRSGCSDRSL